MEASPNQQETTTKTRWYHHKYNNTLALKIVFTIIPRLPKFLHPPIAVVTALIFFTILEKERRAIIKNLGVICPGGRLKQWWKAYRVFYNFCDFVVSYCFVPGMTRTEIPTLLTDPERGAQKTERCLAEGRGLIVWTAHVGNWEYGSRLLELYGRPVNIARVVETDKPSEMMLRKMMENDLLRVIQLNGDVFAGVELLLALRRNEILAIQGDRVYQNFWAETKFFGRRARFPLGPFFLSYISGAPILPGFVVREKWLKYRVVMGDPIVLPQTGDRDNDLQAGLEKAVRFLEEHLQRYHDQWLNFYDFWNLGETTQTPP